MKKTDVEKLDKACSSYQAGMSAYEVADLTGVSRPVLYRQLAKRGIKNQTALKGNSRIYQCNDNAFEIPSEERDYWVGMLMADGCVYKSRSSFLISLGLKKSDFAHINKFKKFLQAENPVRLHGSMSVLNIRSLQITKSLAAFGVVPRKTFTAEIIGLESSRHFWRGVVDGDGSLYLSVFRTGLKKNEYKLPTISLVGSKPLLTQFLAFVSTVAPLCKATARPKENIFEVKIGGRYAVLVIKNLYSDCSIALVRKKLLADNFINQSVEPFDENPWAKKLTTPDVIKMREMYATGRYSCYRLDQLFRLHKGNAWTIVTRKTWKHI